jgi:hypothetical protein
VRMVGTWAELQNHLDLVLEKCEGKGSCWWICIGTQIKGFLPENKARNLTITGRELDFRLRWWLAKMVVKGILKGDLQHLGQGDGEQTLVMLNNILQVPQTAAKGKTQAPSGFDPTTSGWEGSFCHALLAQCEPYSNSVDHTPQYRRYCVLWSAHGVVVRSQCALPPCAAGSSTSSWLYGTRGATTTQITSSRRSCRDCCTRRSSICSRRTEKGGVGRASSRRSFRRGST